LIGVLIFTCALAQKKKLKNIDPESLIPSLPKPKDLKPFPTTLNLEYVGHTEKIRSIAVSPSGQWLASGSDDCTVRVWEIDTGRCFKKWTFSDVINLIAWNPLPSSSSSSSSSADSGFGVILAVAVGTRIILLNTQTGSGNEMKAVEELFHLQADTTLSVVTAKPKKQKRKDDDENENKISNTLFAWKRVKDVSFEAKSETQKKDEEEEEEEKSKEKEENKNEEEEKHEWKDGWSRVVIDVGKRTKSLEWHNNGDYLASVSADGASTATVLIHRLSKHTSQSPFSKNKGLVQKACFHPTKPHFVVATQRHIRVYNLVKQQLVKKLLCPGKWISSLALHPGGDHLLIGSLDRKVCWYDLDLASTPYKTLKYHTKAVRSVRYHSRYPLFATSSDDGKVHLFHATIYTDMVTNPMIVPLKVLHAHQTIKDLGALDCIFHPFQPWLFTAGADHHLKLFT